MKALVPVLIICALAVASGFTVSDVREEAKPKGRYAGLEAHETHASASLLGQFRTSVSGWLWLRTDLYLHNGVAMRPLTDQEIASGRTGVGSSDNHGVTSTTIPKSSPSSPARIKTSEASSATSSVPPVPTKT